MFCVVLVRSFHFGVTLQVFSKQLDPAVLVISMFCFVFPVLSSSAFSVCSFYDSHYRK